MTPALPPRSTNEYDVFLTWLAYLRGAVLRNLDGLDEVQARWTPEGSLISVLGVVNHLTHVEWRWIDGGFCGAATMRDESEFHPGPELTVEEAVRAYRERATKTEAAVRALPLETPCASDPAVDLRWVLMHLVNETARHAGHADATRELVDGRTGE